MSGNEITTKPNTPTIDSSFSGTNNTKRILPSHRRSQSVGVCELKSMISDFEITTHPPTPSSPTSMRKMNGDSSTQPSLNNSSSNSINNRSLSLSTSSSSNSVDNKPIISNNNLKHVDSVPSSDDGNLSSSPTSTSYNSNNSGGGSSSPNTSFNPSLFSSVPPQGGNGRKAPRKVSFKESFLSAMSKPRRFIGKLSPRGTNEKQQDATILERNSEYNRVSSDEVIKDNSVDMRRSLDPGLLQREVFKKNLKEKHKPEKSILEKFMTPTNKITNDSSRPIRLLSAEKMTTQFKKFLNPQLVLYIMDFLFLPFGRYLSKTTKTPFNRDNYFKLFFGKFKLGFFQRGNSCSNHSYFLIFKHIYISDNFYVDFTDIGSLFQGVPLAKIESLTFIQFRTGSDYPSCLATLQGKIPFILQYMTSLKRLYINTEYITNDDIQLLLDPEVATEKSLQLHHKEYYGLFYKKTKKITYNLNQNKVRNIMGGIEELVIGSLQDISSVNIQDLANLKYFVWRSRVDGTLLFNSQPETFKCTTLELSKVMLKPSQLKLIFSELPNLTTLKIEYLASRLSHKSIYHLQENNNLKRLTLRYCKNVDYNIGDVICISLSNHPTLCTLDISGMETRDEAIQYLLVAGKNVITSFKCKGRLLQTDNSNSEVFSMIQGSGFKDIHLNTMLSSLDLSNHPITLEGLTIICQSTSITQLILKNCSLDNTKVRPLLSTSPLSNRIKLLDLSRNLLNDRFMNQSPLFSSPRNPTPSPYWKNLKSLNLSYNPMSVNVLKGLIAHCSTMQYTLKKSLKSLFVNGLNIRDEGLILILLTFENLEEIEAINCGITNKSLHMLGNSKNIKRCKFNQNQIIFDKVLLTNLFTQNTTMESIGLVSCILPKEKDFKRIAKYLVVSHTIQSIALNHCYFPIQSNEPVEESELSIDYKAEDQFRATCSNISKIKFFCVQNIY